MKNYHDRCKEATLKIHDMIKKGHKREEIYFKIMIIYGLSQKFCDKQIDLFVQVLELQNAQNSSILESDLEVVNK